MNLLVWMTPYGGRGRSPLFALTRDVYDSSDVRIRINAVTEIPLGAMDMEQRTAFDMQNQILGR